MCTTPMVRLAHLQGTPAPGFQETLKPATAYDNTFREAIRDFKEGSSAFSSGENWALRGICRSAHAAGLSVRKRFAGWRIRTVAHSIV
jgi:hypothetical protein